FWHRGRLTISAQGLHCLCSLLRAMAAHPCWSTGLLLLFFSICLNYRSGMREGAGSFRTPSGRSRTPAPYSHGLKESSSHRRAASVMSAEVQPTDQQLESHFRCTEPQKGMPMSTPTKSPRKPEASTSAVQSHRPGEAISPKAWVAKAAKQPLVLETVDMGP